MDSIIKIIIQSLRYLDFKIVIKFKILYIFYVNKKPKSWDVNYVIYFNC